MRTRHRLASTASRLPRARRVCTALAVLVVVAACPLSAKEPQDATQGLLKVAAKARQGVVRIRWRNDRDADDEVVRNAIVVSSAGHLLLAGPRPAYMRGTIYAEFANGDTVKASYVDSDPLTGLTLLHVNYGELQPLRFRPAALVHPTQAPADPKEPSAAEAPAAPGVPHAAGSRPAPDEAEPRVLRRRPLQTLPLGLHVMMVTGDGAVAQGTLRAHDRRIPILHAGDTRVAEIGALVEAGMGVLATDQGSPWLDEDGNVAALQIATGYAHVLPEQLDAAGAGRLRPRMAPSAALAVPASVLRVVTPRLIQRKPVRRAGLGIHTRLCNRLMRQHLTGGHGCHVVLELDPRGPAALAGVRKHDLIVRINGEALRPSARLIDVLLPFRPGDPVTVGLLRKGQRLDVECEFVAR